jgi:SdpC family antimicrobial peptide
MTQTFKIAIVTALISSMALLGLPSQTFAQEPSTPTVFTGEQIFRGIFLGQAPVSQLFPEMWGKDQMKLSEWDEMDEQIVARIIANDWTFMARFATEMQSADHLRVQATLDEAGQATVRAMQELGYMDKEGNPAEALASGDCAFRVLVAVYVVAVAVVVWAFLYFKPRPGFVGDSSVLRRDTLIQLITERLGAKS